MILNNSTMGQLGPNVAVPAYDRGALRGGIVHIGVGSFFRVHGAAYVDACLHRPDQDAWGIVGIGLQDGPAARAKADAFRAQDGLFTMTAFKPDGSAECRVIGALIEYLHAPSDPEAALARLAHPDTRIVTLTITEGGYNIDEATGAFMLETPAVAADLRGGPPTTAFAYLVEALARRRAAGLPAFTIASCDNLRGSGDTTRAAVLGYAQARDPDLAAWIGDNVDFPNSMVDRLAPQVPDDQRAALNARSGIEDRMPVFTEDFTQWVMEDRFRHGRPALDMVGVQFRDNVADYLAVKGRLINASHVLLSYPALLMGYRIVADALHDPLLVELVETFVNHDAKLNVQGPPGLSLDAYAAGFVPRFANRAIADQLLRVAGDGTAKLPTFHGKTIAMLIASGGDLRREAFLMACFGRYLRFGLDDSLRDDRGERFTPFEPGLTKGDWEMVGGSDPSAVLRVKALDSLRLSDDPGFRPHFDRYAASLAERGARQTLQDLLV